MLSCPANDLQSHRPPSRSTEQVSLQPGHCTLHRTADHEGCEVSTEVRGLSLIISKAGNRSVLTAASIHAYPFRQSIMETRERASVSIIDFFIIVLHAYSECRSSHTNIERMHW